MFTQTHHFGPIPPTPPVEYTQQLTRVKQLAITAVERLEASHSRLSSAGEHLVTSVEHLMSADNAFRAHDDIERTVQEIDRLGTKIETDLEPTQSDQVRPSFAALREAVSATDQHVDRAFPNPPALTREVPHVPIARTSTTPQLHLDEAAKHVLAVRAALPAIEMPDHSRHVLTEALKRADLAFRQGAQSTFPPDMEHALNDGQNALADVSGAARNAGQAVLEAAKDAGLNRAYSASDGAQLALHYIETQPTRDHLHQAAQAALRIYTAASTTDVRNAATEALQHLCRADEDTLSPRGDHLIRDLQDTVQAVDGIRNDPASTAGPIRADCAAIDSACVAAANSIGLDLQVPRLQSQAATIALDSAGFGQSLKQSHDAKVDQAHHTKIDHARNSVVESPGFGQ